MLFILFQIGRDRYALAASSIIEVLPLMNLKRVPCAPVGVAGVLNYRGTPVPVIDLNEMTLARTCSAALEHAHHPGEVSARELSIRVRSD